MALNRKYAALPDLDSAPDIYETPDLTDDNSTAPTGTVRSQSAASDYHDFPENDRSSSNISRSRLQPDEARAHFEPAQIDAREVDFSDRVNGKRKSYKASSRRQRRGQNDVTELGDFSDEDEEEGESLGRKMARLRRELEEVKEEYGRRRQEKERQDALLGEDEEDEAIALSKILDSISTEEGGAGADSGNRLMKALGTNLQIQRPAVPSEVVPTSGSTTYTVTYAPGYEQSHTLAKAADFDNRLAFLEKSLGITSTATPALDSKGIPAVILPSLDILQRQIQVLSSSTPSSLDSISRRVRTLTQEAERLSETRKAAKVSQDDLRAAGEDAPKDADGNSMDDPEQTSKINALYGTLSTIESLAPLLPALLDRLRSLRTIHSDAATAHEGIERALAKQESMDADIKRWRDGLEKVEAAVKNSDATMGNNVVALEGWVKDLEKRMEKLGQS